VALRLVRRQHCSSAVRSAAHALRSSSPNGCTPVPTSDHRAKDGTELLTEELATS
jgi:hypothetical protein